MRRVVDEKTADQTSRSTTSIGTLVLVIMIAGIAGLAVYASLSVRSLREAHEVLAQQIQTLRHQAASPVTHPAKEPRRVLSDDPSAQLQTELGKLRQRVAQLESGAAASVARDELFDRFHLSEGAARALTLQDLAELARFDDQEALDAIMLALEDADPSVRRQAVKALRKLADPDTIGYLDSLLDDPSPGVRMEAAKALGQMREWEAGPLLTNLLDDSNPSVSAEAIKSLVDLGYRAAGPDIAELIWSDSPKVTTAAGRAMRKFGDAPATEMALARVADGLQDPNPLARLRAVSRIRKIGSPAALPYLEQALDDEDCRVREKAVTILNRREHESAVFVSER